MISNFLIKQEYENDKKLKKDDVQVILEWVKKQPHLPQNITEFQVILFLQSCNYSNETTKKTIDSFFTSKFRNSSVFQNRDPFNPTFKTVAKASFMATLPKKTPEGFTLCLYKTIDTNPEKFNFLTILKLIDMIGSLHLHQNGISEGYLLLIDLEGFSLSKFTKIIAAGPSVLKQFFEYSQESAPLKLKGVHYFNLVPFIDKINVFLKSLLKKELVDVMYFHNTIDDLVKMVPLECLPKEYGGPLDDIYTLHENAIKNLQENVEFFKWEDEQIQMLDESKRVDKFDSFDGSFKKLEID